MAFAVSKALHLELGRGIRKLDVCVDETFHMDGDAAGTVKNSEGYMSIFRRSETIPEAFNQLYQMDQEEFADGLLAGALPGLDVEDLGWRQFSGGRQRDWFLSVKTE